MSERTHFLGEFNLIASLQKRLKHQLNLLAIGYLCAKILTFIKTFQSFVLTSYVGVQAL